MGVCVHSATILSTPELTAHSFDILSPGWAGVGSGIFPEQGVFMRVGGNIEGGKTDGSTWAMTKGSIQYGGSCTTYPANRGSVSGHPDALACGSLFVNTDG